MARKKKYELNSEQVQEIKRASQASNAKVARRALIVYALHMGHTVREVARMHNVARSTVYNTVNRYQQEGVEGLKHRKKTGRPTALSTEQRTELARVVESDPRELGYEFTIWTSQRLQNYLREEMSIEVSEGTIRNTLRQMGYVFRRPKKSLEHMQDPTAVEAFKRLLPELKKEHSQVSLGSSLWTKPDLN